MSDMMKSAAHNISCIGINQARHAVEHGTRSLVGKCSQQNIFLRNTAFQQAGDSVS